MTRTVAIVLLFALGSIGLLAALGTSLADLRATRQAAEEAADAKTRSDLVALGWQPPASESLRGLVERLRSTHGVEILHVTQLFRFEMGYREVAGGPGAEAATAAATVLVADELALYPPGLLGRSGLRRVALCSTLRENGAPIPSLPNYRATMLLDVDAAPDFLRRLVHHEVFHFADLAEDGVLLWDPDWERLNPPGFEYGRGGRDMREPSASALTEERAGFLTRYATSALEEDKAETFALLVTQPDDVERRAAHDAVLAAKVARVREVVASLDPSADQAFWARIGRHRAHRAGVTR